MTVETMRISQVAARSGVPATTLRFYEELGMLRPRRATNGYRVYDGEALERLRFVEAAKTLNLPLEQIATLLSVWEAEPCADVKARLRPLLADQLDLIDTTIGELSAARQTLAAAAEHLDELPDRAERCSPECAFLAAAPSPPVACSLGPGQAARVADWHEAVAGAPIRAVPGGVRIDLPTGALDRITALAVAEQRCCPFFTFHVALHGPRVTLTATAPAEARPLLDDLFPTHEARADPEDSDLDAS